MSEVKFTSHKSSVLSAMQKAKDRALEIIGSKAEDYAVINITKNHSVITGNLRGSITHKQIDDNTVAVGTNVEYAPYVELGHHTKSGSFVAPKPYLRPAVEEHMDEYKSVAEKEMKNA